MPANIDYSKFENFYSTRNKKRPYIFFIILFSLFLIGLILNTASSKNKNQTLINPLSESLIEKGKNILTSEKAKENELEKIVTDALSDSEGRYAIAIKNLQNDNQYFINENAIFETASLYKLFVMATVLEQIGNGTLSYDQVLSQDIPILNEKFGIATDSAELKEGSITLKVDDALTKMVTISDNYSALLLSERVRISNVTKFLEENEFDKSRMGTLGGSPITTASDVLLFFEKLYKGQIIDKKNSDSMLALLKNQELNSKLPKYLPENIEMAHKTGELGRLSHDAGIVYNPSGDYIIVVLSETSTPLEANEKMAEISKEIYEYFSD